MDCSCWHQMMSRESCRGTLLVSFFLVRQFRIWYKVYSQISELILPARLTYNPGKIAYFLNGQFWTLDFIPTQYSAIQNLEWKELLR